MNLGGFSNISQGRSESREKFQGKPMRRNSGQNGNPRYNSRPRSLFSPDSNTPTGYAADGTTLLYGNRPDGNQPQQPGSVTVLTPVQPRGYQAPNVLAMEPGVKTSTYAFQDMSKAGAQQNVSLNLDKPAGTPTTSNAPQTESNNPLTGDTNSQPAGKTTGLTPIKQPDGSLNQPQQKQAGSVTGLTPVQPASNQSLAKGSPQNEGYNSQGQIVSSPAPDIDHARALGLSTKGNGTPSGDDISTPGQPASFAGGSGDSQRSFSNPTSAAIYGDYVKKLFGGGDGSQPTGYAANGTSLQTGQDQASAMATQLKAQPKAQPQPQPQDQA